MSALGFTSPVFPAEPIPVMAQSEVAASAFITPTAKEIQAEIEQVLNKQLSADLVRWVDGYAQVGKRNIYLWKWVRQGIEVTALSCLAPELFDFACDTKVLGVVLHVLLDDIADCGGDPNLLE